MTDKSYLLGGHDVRFWVEGLVIMVVVFWIIKLIFSDPYAPERRGFWNWAKGWLNHYKKDFFLSVAIPYVCMLALEWSEPLFLKYTSIDLPHSENDFLYFIPFTGIVAWRTSLKWHKHENKS